MSQYLLNTYKRNTTNFISGKNARLYDTNNNEYIDFGAGIGVVSVGHSNTQLANAITDQANKIIHISNLFTIDLQEKLAQKLVTLSTYNNMKVFFANSGAEANEGAIKIARKYGQDSNRSKIITLINSFHGRTIATLKATGQSDMHKSFGPFPDGFDYAKDLSDVYNHIDGDTIAVMIELISGEGGVQEKDKQEVQKLAKYLKEKNILLIIDEVQTGIYRTGELLASNIYGITPDIITLAKGLAGGVPIGAVMTSLVDVLGNGDHGSTFGGNYLSSRAGIEVLDILTKSKSQINENINYLQNRLLDIANEYNLKLTGIGYMRGLKIKDDETLISIIQKCLDNGLVILKSGNSTLRFLPPLSITVDELDQGLNILNKVLKDTL